jgi:SAM-dependent methyltransferase
MLNKFQTSAHGPVANEKPYRAEMCNICGSSQYRKIHYFGEFNLGRKPVKNVFIVQCRNCRIRRRMPEIIDDFEEEYHLQFLNQGQNIHPHQLSHFADLMTARVRQLTAENVTFLDVGCSTGRILRLASTLGFRVTGLDYSQWAAEYCAKLGFSIRQGSLIGQWQESELFDIIHCSHTIEHIPDPVAYINEMRRLLKPGGNLMLACPNYASFPRLVMRKRWMWHLDTHLWQFTAKQMRELLIRCGLRPLTIRTLHGYTPDSHFKKRVLDITAMLGWGDGLNIVAIRC